MEREANYAAVGAFVLLVALIGALFVYWYSDSREHRELPALRDLLRRQRQRPRARRGRCAISAWTSGASSACASIRGMPSRVQVIVDIDSSTPISDKTVAELLAAGRDGTAVHRSADRSRGNVQLTAGGAEREVSGHPLGALRVSMCSWRSLPDVVGLGRRGRRARRTCCSATRTSTRCRTRSPTSKRRAAELPETLREVNALVARLASADEASWRRRAHSAHGGRAVGRARRSSRPCSACTSVADNLANATGQLEKIIEDNRQDVRSFTRDGLPELERLLREGPRGGARRFGSCRAACARIPRSSSISRRSGAWRFRDDAATTRWRGLRAGRCVLRCRRVLRLGCCCGGLHSDAPPRAGLCPARAALPAADARPADAASAARQPPDGRPGPRLDRTSCWSQSDRRMSYYIASRWPAALPAVVEALAVETLRASRRLVSGAGFRERLSSDYLLQIGFGVRGGLHGGGSGARGACGARLHVRHGARVARSIASFVAEGSAERRGQQAERRRGRVRGRGQPGAGVHGHADAAHAHAQRSESRQPGASITR